jgi:hypothetical protein
MKLFFIAVLLFVGFSLGVAFAQAPPSPLQQPPTQSELENQMSEIGCKAERQAAASTIVSQQKQIADLTKQLAAMKDPPSKGGATKH